MFYIYVKSHSVTGLKYLGYTSAKDPHKYPGSGKYWVRHLKKHGYNYTTEILKECDSKDEVLRCGLYYSSLWNVVLDSNWANLTEERGHGGNLTEFWSNTSQLKNKEARDAWTLKTLGKTYEEIHGAEKSDRIKQKQSLALKGKKLNLSNDERNARRDRISVLNQLPGKWSDDSISKRTTTFKERQCNIGIKNGMKTKPESRLAIAEKNSKIHILQHIITNEHISVKNISQWAREQGLLSSTVLTKFCKNKPVNNWIRLRVE